MIHQSLRALALATALFTFAMTSQAQSSNPAPSGLNAAQSNAAQPIADQTSAPNVQLLPVIAPTAPPVMDTSKADIAKLTQQVKDNTLHVELLVMVFAGALVFFMQLGFAFLESGMSRTKNTVNVLMKNFCDLCVGSVAFWCVGYGLMYGANASGWVGTSYFFPATLSAKEAGVFFFQVMFAAAAATIVSGAVAERTRFTAYLVGSVFICGVIYPIVGSWVWGSNHGGEGWLKQMGFIDFAGSTVVHSVGGWCALAALMVVRPRLGRYAPDGTPRLIEGHSMSNTVLGALVLWVGWFGFNAGSVVTLEGSTMADMGKIAMNTHLAGCAGALTAMLALRLAGKKIMLSVTVNGAISGLVAVTAGSSIMAPQWAIVTGAVAGILTTLVQPALEKFKLDDVVGAISVHLVGGIWGTLAAGLFGTAHFFSFKQAVTQLTGIAAVGVFTFSAAYLMYRLIESTIGMRVTPQEELRGLDIAEHAELGYPEFQRNQLHTGAAAAQSGR